LVAIERVDFFLGQATLEQLGLVRDPTPAQDGVLSPGHFFFSQEPAFL